jgi:hypothetical protein
VRPTSSILCLTESSKSRNMHSLLLNAKPRDLADLSPEQKKTLQFLLDHWPKHKDILNSKPIPQHGIPSGFFSTSYELVCADELPTENHWIWRQCNAKVAVALDAVTTVVMQKLNTRANITKSTDAFLSRPSSKLWNLRVIQTSSSFTFLYCEKGVEETKTPLDSSQPQEVRSTGEFLGDQASADVGDFDPHFDWSGAFCESPVAHGNSDCFGGDQFDANEWAWLME